MCVSLFSLLRLSLRALFFPFPSRRVYLLAAVPTLLASSSVPPPPFCVPAVVVVQRTRRNRLVCCAELSRQRRTETTARHPTDRSPPHFLTSVHRETQRESPFVFSFSFSFLFLFLFLFFLSEGCCESCGWLYLPTELTYDLPLTDELAVQYGPPRRPK